MDSECPTPEILFPSIFLSYDRLWAGIPSIFLAFCLWPGTGGPKGWVGTSGIVPGPFLFCCFSLIGKPKMKLSEQCLAHLAAPAPGRP